MICSYFLILPDLVLEDFMFLQMYPFFPDHPICCYIVFCNIFLQSFSISMVSAVTSFLSDFIYLSLLSFFFMSLVKGLSILFIFSKNQVLVSSFAGGPSVGGADPLASYED